MRLLILNYEYPPLGGGAGMVTQHLARELVALDCTTTIITTWMPGLLEKEEQGGLTIIRLKSKRRNNYSSNPFEMLSWMQHTKKYLLQHGAPYDICLANFMLPGGGVALWLQKKWGIPYVVLSHGHDIPWAFPRQMFLWHVLCFPVLKSIAHRASHIVVLTDELKKIADRFTGASQTDKIVLIPNGMHTPVLPKKSFDGGMEVVYGGRLVAQKDPFTFLEAVKRLQQQGFNPFRVTIIGDGERRAAMEQYIEKNELKGITFTGKIPHPEVMAIFRRAHVLVSTSVYEAMSLTMLEALSEGMYVLSTPVTGTEGYILEDVSGNYIPFGHAAELATAIIKYHEEKYQQQYELPVARIVEQPGFHHWQSIAERYQILFKEILMDTGNGKW